MLTLILCTLTIPMVLAAPGTRPLDIRQDTIDRYADWPSYSQLPLNASYPPRAAWCLWGCDDALGALNHITSYTVVQARNEIVQGQTFQLNLPLGEPVIPINPGRKPLQHLFQPEEGYTDDVVVMNTQIGTQYDGLRHLSYSTNGNVSTYQYYNDLISDYEDVIGSAPTEMLGLSQAAEKAIAARGVLLDFAGWAAAQNITFNVLTSNYSINVTQLDAVAAWQGLPSNWSRPGDILFVRTGWLQQYRALTVYQQDILPFAEDSASGGLLASEETLKWVWDKKLALIGGDNPAVETSPFEWSIDGIPRSMHQVFLGGKSS